MTAFQSALFRAHKKKGVNEKKLQLRKLSRIT
jgi:hypothetical protein